MFWNRSKVKVETAKSPKPVSDLHWEHKQQPDGYSSWVAYPEMGKANWERYSVTYDEAKDLWVIRWQMAKMNAVIGFANASYTAKMNANTHYQEEVRAYGNYGL